MSLPKHASKVGKHTDNKKHAEKKHHNNKHAKSAGKPFDVYESHSCPLIIYIFFAVTMPRLEMG